MSKVKILFLQSSKEKWLEEAQVLFTKKINHYTNFSVESIKTKSLSRAQRLIKVRQEKELIFKKISKDNFLIALDEKGFVFKDSIVFSKKISNIIETTNKNIVFLIGGSYGLDDEIKQRANLLVSLSSLTMSHHVAQLMLLEQVYRAFTIINNLPYHNE